MPTIYDHLVDHSLIEDAKADHEWARRALATADAELQTAREALEAAHIASRRAAAGIGIDPLTAEAAIEDADRLLRVATKAHASKAETEHRARARIDVASGRAWAEVAAVGVRARLAATQKADIARAALLEAEIEFKAGADAYQAAISHGVGGVAMHGETQKSFKVESGPPAHYRSHAEEVALWNSRGGFDEATGMWGWRREFASATVSPQ